MSALRRTPLVVLALAAVSCRSGSVEDAPISRAEAPIVAGTLDKDDPAVVFILILSKDQTNGELCTGTVVSPHVIATAAHCLSPAILTPSLGAGYTFEVFIAPDNNDPVEAKNQSNFVLGSTAVIDPAFDPNVHDVHDVGALVTKTALAID